MLKNRLLILVFCLSHLLSAAPSYDELVDDLYAVHATSRLPIEGRYTAGLDMPEDFVPPTYFALPHIRYTMHFALGELVRPVGDWKKWDECPYALVTPLRDLTPQLLNLNCYDTFILGDFTLSEQSVLVAPYGTDYDGAIWPYDPETESLREAVDACIASAGGWTVRMESGDEEELLRPALRDGENINNAEFFAALLHKHPQVAVGLRFDEHHKEHWRLSILENYLLGTFSHYALDHNEAHYWTLEETKELEREYCSWRRSMEGARLGPEAITALLDLERSVLRCRNLIVVECELAEHGLTLWEERGLDELRAFFAATEDLQELRTLAGLAAGSAATPLCCG